MIKKNCVCSQSQSFSVSHIYGMCVMWCILTIYALSQTKFTAEETARASVSNKHNRIEKVDKVTLSISSEKEREKNKAQQSAKTKKTTKDAEHGTERSKISRTIERQQSNRDKRTEIYLCNNNNNHSRTRAKCNQGSTKTHNEQSWTRNAMYNQRPTHSKCVARNKTLVSSKFPFDIAKW